jgi:hypothetical protein
MQPFYKDVAENGTIKEICDLFKGKGNTINAIHMVAIECLSTLMCPVYGDFYSFPWKRGPHDNILEYTEAQITFELVREKIYLNIKDYDFVGRTLAIFIAEDENKN